MSFIEAAFKNKITIGYETKSFPRSEGKEQGDMWSAHILSNNQLYWLLGKESQFPFYNKQLLNTYHMRDIILSSWDDGDPERLILMERTMRSLHSKAGRHI